MIGINWSNLLLKVKSSNTTMSEHKIYTFKSVNVCSPRLNLEVFKIRYFKGVNLEMHCAIKV